MFYFFRFIFLLFYRYFMRRTFYVLDGEDIIALFLGIAGHIV